MGKLLFVLSLLIGLLALIRSVLERRGPKRLPILILLRDRFPSPQLKWILTGLAVGSFLVIGPLSLALGLGWAWLEINGALPNPLSPLGLITLGLKLGWAAVEELIFRGAILPQAAKVMNGLAALIVSSVLFGLLTKPIWPQP